MRPLTRLLITLAATSSLGVAAGQSTAATPEATLARADAQAIVAAYARLLDGSSVELCRLMSTRALRELGGLGSCTKTMDNQSKPSSLRTKVDLADGRLVTQAYLLRHLKIRSVTLESRGGKRYATVVLLPKLGSGHWQWILLKENGHYRLFEDIG
jgi:hypothetical protein